MLAEAVAGGEGSTSHSRADQAPRNGASLGETLSLRGTLHPPARPSCTLQPRVHHAKAGLSEVPGFGLLLTVVGNPTLEWLIHLQGVQSHH